MPILEKDREQVLCPEGLHQVQLVSVEPITMKNFDGEGEVERLIWRFVSNQKAPDGANFEVPVFTGYKFGWPTAGLTKLLRLMKHKITDEEGQNLDTDQWIGLKWEATVSHEPQMKDPEKLKAVIVFMKPLGTAAADKADPFFFEDGASPPDQPICGWLGCSAALTDAELKASAKKWGDQRQLCRKHGAEQVALDRVEAIEKAAAAHPIEEIDFDNE